MNLEQSRKWAAAWKALAREYSNHQELVRLEWKAERERAEAAEADNHRLRLLLHDVARGAARVKEGAHGAFIVTQVTA